MSTISTATPVIIGASGVQGSTGVTGTSAAIGMMGMIGLPFVNLFSARMIVTSQLNYRAKHWWQRSYDMSLSYVDGEDVGLFHVVSCFWFYNLNIKCFRRTVVKSNCLLTAIIVFAEQEA